MGYYKGDNMSMLKSEVNGNVLETPANLTNVALGLYKNKQNGEWTVARILFDPTTKAAKFEEGLPSADGTADAAIEKFKLLASREVLP